MFSESPELSNRWSCPAPRRLVPTLFLALLLALTLNLSGCGSSYSGTTLTGIDIAPISPSIAAPAMLFSTIRRA